MCVGSRRAPTPPSPPPTQTVTPPEQVDPRIAEAGRDARRRYGSGGRRGTILTLGQGMSSAGKTVLGG